MTKNNKWWQGFKELEQDIELTPTVNLSINHNGNMLQKV